MTDSKTKAAPTDPRPASRTATARTRAVDAYDHARANLKTAGRNGREEIDKSPLIALAGGLAAGALVAALLPRTRAEDKLLGSAGRKIADAGRSAADAARAAGAERLSDLNLTRDAGAGLVRSVIDGIGQAARASGDAAVRSVRGE